VVAPATGEERADRRAEGLRERRLLRLDQRDVHAERTCRRSDLGAYEPAADHGKRASLAQLVPERKRIVERAKRPRARQ
jgi:hypothetical protein